MLATREGETLNRPWSRQTRVLVVACLALTLGACGGGEPPEPDATNPVLMYDNAFNPPVIRIGAGEQVTWKNVGRNPHNAVPTTPAGPPKSASGTS